MQPTKTLLTKRLFALITLTLLLIAATHLL